MRSFGLPAHDFVGLAVIGAPFRMADDHCAAAGILEHFGRDITGVGATGTPVANLTADPDLGALDHRPYGADEGSRWADHDIAFEADVLEHAREQPRLFQRWRGAVHFPVSRHQRSRRFLSHFSPLPNR